MIEEYDTAIIGGGISGFTSALRLQKKGFNTVVFEAHGQIGGCAGFFSKKGFSFDVGATALVDFVEHGVGGNFFKEINLDLTQGEYIDYIAWLPDRHLTLYLNAIPQDIGVENFWLAGDNTWPGLGTVAGLISGRIAAEYAAK